MSGENKKSNKKNRKDALLLISILERAEHFATISQNNELRAHVLYFLAYIYFTYDDIVAAKEKLKKCIKLNSKFRKSAQYFLAHLWDREMKPHIWQWWLFSPLHTWLRRIIFVIILTCIFFLFVFHPCIWGISIPICNLFNVCNYSIEINWTVYIMLITILILILLLPTIQRFRFHDLDIEFNAPSHFDLLMLPPFLSGDLSKEYRTGRRVDTNIKIGIDIEKYSRMIETDLSQ